MPVPKVHKFPVKRPGFIEQAQWIGDDDDLSLQVSYRNEEGNLQSISFETRNADPRPGEICLPNTNDVLDLGPRVRDILVAHVRMACMIAGLAVPGSKEFSDAFVQSEANHLQTAIGTVKVTDIVLIDDLCLDMEFKRGGGPKRVFRIDHDELNEYKFVPSTQLLVIPGAIEKEFSGAVHDHPNEVLTQQEKDDIVAYLLSLALWV